MWSADIAVLESTAHYRLRESGVLMSWRLVVERWRQGAFADWFTQLLAASEWPAFFWECPPLTLSGMDEVLEFVLVDSRALAGISPDPSAFRGQFRSDALSVSFFSLGRDAFLVAPCPGEGTASSAHLASFVRGAPRPSTRALWAAVSDGLLDQVDDQKLWLSTSGLGVYWVHVRMDRRPKYYTYRPYRSG